MEGGGSERYWRGAGRVYGVGDGDMGRLKSER